jgi:hypothetical protein
LAPVIAALAGIGPVRATSDTGAIVNYPAATVSDNAGTTPTITYSQPSGTVFPLGITTVIVTAMDSAGNAAASSFTVTVSSPAAVESWRLAHFGTSTDSGRAANRADPNGDGLVNLLKFAFGTDPQKGGSGASPLVYSGSFAGGGTMTSPGQPRMAFESGPGGIDARVLFVRRADYGAARLTYLVEFSADLITWVPASAAPSVLADDGTLQIVSAPIPPIPGALFFRLNVSLAP